MAGLPSSSTALVDACTVIRVDEAAPAHVLGLIHAWTERHPEAPPLHGGVEDRVVGGMEDAVAEPGREGGQQQHPVRRDQPRGPRGAREQRHAGQQHPERPEAVDQEPGDGLPEARCGVEDGDDQPQRDVGDAQLVAEQREQGRQDQLEEVAREVNGADDRDDARVADIPGPGPHRG